MMVIYLPVKFEFNWTNRFRVRVQKRKCGQTDGRTNEQKMDKRTDGITPISMETKMWTDRRKDKQTKNRQTNRRNYTNFERNLAMMVIYVPVKFEFDWTNCF